MGQNTFPIFVSKLKLRNTDVSELTNYLGLHLD